jgi:tetratricopeptide (TPR) repeat protein
MKLDDHYRTLAAPRYTEDDHVANQIKYLRQSKCFQNSDELTCTTCHNPHRRESHDDSGLNSCLKCHQRTDCSDQERLPAAVQTRCVACHMPAYVKVNVNFETQDDNYVPPMQRCEHRIGIHPRARQEVLRDWLRTQSDQESRDEADRLTRELVEGWLAEAESCRRDYRFMGAIAAIREACRIAPGPTTKQALRAAVADQSQLEDALASAVQQVTEQHYQDAIQLLNEILVLKPDHAKAHGKLGTAYAAIDTNDLALAHWEAVAKYDPDDPYGHSMIAWQAYLQNRAEDALEPYRRADEVDPYIAPINFRWGLALARLGRWDEAADRFRYAVQIDPYDSGGYQGLALALSNQGQFSEALGPVRRAARLSKFLNPEILLALSEIYAELGRYAEASDAANKALEVELSQGSQLAPQIEKRIERLRMRAKSAGRKGIR